MRRNRGCFDPRKESRRERGKWHGENDVVEESGPFVGLAVAIGIFQNGNPTGGFVLELAVNVGHVAAHFANPHPTGGIEGQGDRLVDKRLCSNRLDHESLLDGESFECFVDTQHGSGGDQFLGHNFAHFIVSLPIAVLGDGRGKTK